MTVKASTANAPTLRDGFDQTEVRFVEVVHKSTAHRVYSRTCVGTGSRHPARDGDYGLSPRLRGNQIPAAHLDHLRGCIPAPAGEPTHSNYVGAHGKVYPRACGGTVFAVAQALSQYGLSPRLRGNPSR